MDVYTPYMAHKAFKYPYHRILRKEEVLKKLFAIGIIAIAIASAAVFIKGNVDTAGLKPQGGFSAPSEYGSGTLKEDMLGTFDAAKDAATTTVKDVTLGKTETADTGSELVPAQLIKVVDGDTIIADTGSGDVYVRFIGIDTPESVNPNEEKNTVWGEEASHHTKELLSGVDTVYLQYDKEKQDKYARDLAYVWLKSDANTSDMQDVAGYMLNATILRDGYACDKVFPPNVRYADFFAQLRQEAQDTKTGLWQDEGFAALWQ